MKRNKSKLLLTIWPFTIVIFLIINQKEKKSTNLVFSDIHDKVISNISINNTIQPCLTFSNCRNIIIERCALTNSKDVAISLYRCRNISIKNCYMSNVSSGVYALESQSIRVINNTVQNVQGPYPRGQMVQFDNVSGAGNQVVNNRCENILGQSFAEDAISMYKSKGTRAEPILISGNLIKGGGPSITGGGIMLGDKGGEYIVARNNVLVNPGQYGMAISGGSNMQIINNKIYSKSQMFTNVGLYIWNQNELACQNNIISGNLVNWKNSKGKVNDGWNNGNCGPVKGWETNVWRADIDSTLIKPDFMKYRL
ncbi:right-handed parallel beta-helix repeat-containing protein [Mucilaginibacter sp. HD30]